MSRNGTVHGDRSTSPTPAPAPATTSSQLYIHDPVASISQPVRRLRGGSLAKQGKAPETIGTLPTHRPQFVGMVAGVTLILVALTFLPMLALGPLAEGIH